MKLSNKNMIGVSLIEVILALVIAGGILTMGLRLYQGFMTDAAAQRVRYNAEEIMHAAALYYYANCQNMSGTTGTATLDPANSPYVYTYTSVTVNDLVNSGYLMKAPALNPLVDSSGTGGGYLIQFNRVNPDPDRNYCTTSGGVQTCNKIGKNVIWRIQVSVLLKNTSAATRYMGMTGADCLTSFSGTFNGTMSVVPCSNAASFQSTCQTLWSSLWNMVGWASIDDIINAINMGCQPPGSTAYNNYISWERLPSMVSPKGQSPLWLTNPVNKQFKQYNEQPSLSNMLANPTTYFKCES